MDQHTNRVMEHSEVTIITRMSVGVTFFNQVELMTNSVVISSFYQQTDEPTYQQSDITFWSYHYNRNKKLEGVTFLNQDDLMTDSEVIGFSLSTDMTESHNILRVPLYQE